MLEKVDTGEESTKSSLMSAYCPTSFGSQLNAQLDSFAARTF